MHKLPPSIILCLPSHKVGDVPKADIRALQGPGDQPKARLTGHSLYTELCYFHSAIRK